MLKFVKKIVDGKQVLVIIKTNDVTKKHKQAWIYLKYQGGCYGNKINYELSTDG